MLYCSRTVDHLSRISAWALRLLPLILAACWNSPALAIDTTWIFDGNGNWTESAKWSSGQPTDGTFDVFIDDGDSAAMVTLQTSRSIGSLLIGADDALRIESLFNSISLSVAGDITNSGGINLASTQSAALALNTNTLTNAANGLLHFQSGGTGSRTFSGNLTNDGTVTVDRSTAFTKAGAVYLNRGLVSVAASQTLSITGGGTFDQTAGRLDIDGTMTMTGGTFHYIGGTITGAPLISGGTLAIDVNLTAPYAFALEGSSILSLADGQVRSGQSLTVRHTSTGTQGTTSAATISNFGSISVAGTSSGVTSLTLTTGRLNNEVGGQLSFQAGGTGSRSLLADLTNYGTVVVDQATTLGKTAGDYENNGQFTINASRTLSVTNGGVFTQAAGNLNVAGSTNFSGVTLKYFGGTITGTVQMTNSTLQIDPTAGNSGSFVLNGNNTLVGNVQAGHTLTVQHATTGTQGLTSATGFTSDGVIRLAGSTSGFTQLSLTSGTLVNGPTALLHFQNGGTGSRSLVGDLTNTGNVLVEHDTNFGKTGGVYSNSGQFTVGSGRTLTLTNGGMFSQTDGALDLQGAFSMTGGSFKFLGGSINGTPSLSGVALTIGTSAPANFAFTGNGTLVLPSNVLTDHQLITLQNGTVISANGFANDSEIRWVASGSSGLAIQNGALVNNPEGLLLVQDGGGSATFHGDLTNYGTVTINRLTTLSKTGGLYSNYGQFTVNPSDTLIASGGVFEQLAGTFDAQGTLYLSNLRYLGGSLLRPSGVPIEIATHGSLTIGPDATSPVEFVLSGASTLSGSIQAGQKVTVLGSGSSAYTATSPTGVMNNGSIVLSAGGSGAIQLAITTGALANGPTGVLRFDPGGTGALSFRGDLSNAGTVQVNKSISFTKPAANYLNSGTFTVPSGQTLAMASGGTFEQAAGSLSLTGSMTMTGVALKQTGGTINLNSAGSMTLSNGSIEPAIGSFEHSGGTFNVTGNMNLNGSNYNMTGGTLNVAGNMTINSATFNYFGGTITGSPTLNGGSTEATLHLGAAALNPASFNFLGAGRLSLESGALPAGITVNIGAPSGWPTQVLADGFVNHGSVLFKPGFGSRYLGVLQGTLVNGPTGLIHFENGSGGGLFGDLLNEGTMLLDSLSSIYFDKVNGHYVNAGQFIVQDKLSITGGGVYEQTAGSTRVNGSITITAPIHPIQLTGGQLTGRGTIAAPVLNLAAIVAPGDTLGTLTIQNSYTQHAAGTLNIVLGGVAANEFDVLNIIGAASLAGILNVSLTGGYAPIAGASFDILNWSTLTGVFDTVNLPTLGAGLAWNKSQLYVTGTLSVTTAPPGDFDSDGDVDGADFVAWQTNFPKETGATLAQGDADGDGDVDGADFVVWQTNFPFTPTPGTAPVPEPAGVFLALVGIGFLTAARRAAAR
jgi:hypothetical protein